jgi:ubiquinone/menaquinone biosynthesis C-methylase UbiE
MVLFPKYFPKGTSVLDLGCGLGRLTLRLHEDGHLVQGYDFSPFLVDLANKRFPTLNIHEGDYSNIPEKDGSWDHVICVWGSLDYAAPDKREKAFSEIARVIRKCGYFIMSSYNIRWLLLGALIFKKEKLDAIKNWRFGLRETVRLPDSYDGEAQFSAHSAVVKQAERHGFQFIESLPMLKYPAKWIAALLSPHYYYVFRRV